MIKFCIDMASLKFDNKIIACLKEAGKERIFSEGPSWVLKMSFSCAQGKCLLLLIPRIV